MPGAIRAERTREQRRYGGRHPRCKSAEKKHAIGVLERKAVAESSAAKRVYYL